MTIKTRPLTKEYSENYDRIFRKNEQEHINAIKKVKEDYRKEQEALREEAIADIEFQVYHEGE